MDIILVFITLWMFLSGIRADNDMLLVVSSLYAIAGSIYRISSKLRTTTSNLRTK